MNQALNITQSIKYRQLVLKRMSCFMPPTWVFFPTKINNFDFAFGRCRIFPKVDITPNIKVCFSISSACRPTSGSTEHEGLPYLPIFFRFQCDSFSPQKSSQDLMIKISVSFKKSRMIQEGAHCLAGLLGTDLVKKKPFSESENVWMGVSKNAPHLSRNMTCENPSKIDQLPQISSNFTGFSGTRNFCDAN